MARIPITKEGFEKLRDKLEKMQNDDRIKVEDALGRAREHGDLSENAEYDAAREALWRLDERISELETRLANAEIVDIKNVAHDQVAFGAIVKVEDLDDGEEEEYWLVGEGESDSVNNKIAVSTPFAKGLLGHKVGDEVEIEVPRGSLSYKILEIRYE